MEDHIPEIQSLTIWRCGGPRTAVSTVTETVAKPKMSRTGSRFPFLQLFSFPCVQSRDEPVHSSAVDAGVPVQEVWTPDGPPAPLSEGSAQEPLLVGHRHDGSDHSPVG